MIDIKIVLVNKYGEFVGRKATLSEESYKGLLEMVKTFYTSGGFELTLEDDSFVVFPPDIVKESILKVVKIKE
jgi:hypothetical protein